VGGRHPTWAGFLYLAIVLDVYSRKIIGWAIENHLRTVLVLAALNAAIAQRRMELVVVHSDHGCPYTSYAFGKRCQEMNVMPRWVRSEMPTTTPWRKLLRQPRARSAQSPLFRPQPHGDDRPQAANSLIRCSSRLAQGPDLMVRNHQLVFRKLSC
jgi:hypothetical protein